MLADVDAIDHARGIELEEPEVLQTILSLLELDSFENSFKQLASPPPPPLSPVKLAFVQVAAGDLKLRTCSPLAAFRFI